MRRCLNLICLAALAGQFLCAGPLGTYVFTGTASGLLSNVSFVDAVLTVTASADISAIGNSAAFQFNELDFQPGAAAFVIQGVGSGTFSGLSFIVDNYGTGSLLFSPAGTNLIVLRDADLASPVFSNYFLATSLGPLVPLPNHPLQPFQDVPTSAGGLTVTSYSNIIFRAVVAPEPDSMLLFGAGLLVSVALRLRLRRRV